MRLRRAARRRAASRCAGVVCVVVSLFVPWYEARSAARRVGHVRPGRRDPARSRCCAALALVVSALTERTHRAAGRDRRVVRRCSGSPADRRGRARARAPRPRDRLAAAGAWLALAGASRSCWARGSRCATNAVAVSLRPSRGRARARRPDRAAPLESRHVIDRDEVLPRRPPGAPGAREEEIEPMARELSAVLDHIAHDRRARPRRRPADLARGRGDGRAARRRAAAVPAARARARAGARGRRRRLPGPEPAGMSDASLDADRRRRRRAAIAAGELAAGELFEAYRARAADARRARRAELLHLGRRGRAAQATRRAARRACRWRSRTCSAPRACRASRARGSSRATGRPTPRRSSRGSPRPARRCWQDQPGRVRDGLLDRELGLRPDAQPVGPRRACPAAPRAAAPPRSPPGWRRGRSAPTPAARSASPRRCAGSSG